MRHAGFVIRLNKTDGSSVFNSDASFKVVKGLAGKGISFESSNFPGRFMRHSGFALKIDPKQNSDAYNKDASFIVTSPKYSTGQNRLCLQVLIFSLLVNPK